MHHLFFFFLSRPHIIFLSPWLVLMNNETANVWSSVRYWATHIARLFYVYSTPFCDNVLNPLLDRKRSSVVNRTLKHLNAASGQTIYVWTSYLCGCFPQGLRKCVSGGILTGSVCVLVQQAVLRSVLTTWPRVCMYMQSMTKISLATSDQLIIT